MAKIVEFEGAEYEFPDDATDAEIAAALGGGASAPPVQPLDTTANVPVPRARPDVELQELSSITQNALPGGASPERTTRAGVQGAGRSVADVLGFIPDVPAMGANALLAGTDSLLRMAGGPSVPFRFTLPSDQLANDATKVANMLGIEVMDPQKMSPRESLAYNVNRFGGQAAAGAGALARGAVTRGAELVGETLPRLGDDFLRPYMAAPGKTAAGDTVAGAGAGAGLTASQLVPEDIRSAGGGAAGAGLDLLAMLGGGVGAGTAVEAATGTPMSTVRNVRGSAPARDVSLDPETRMPVSNRAADKAAKFVQGQAIDPQDAARTIDEQVRAFRDADLPLPTTGLISGDTGIEMLERGQRVKNSTGTIINSPEVSADTKARYSFGERDTALRDSAVEQVDSVRGKGIPEAFVQRAEQVGYAKVNQAQKQADKVAGQQRGVTIAQAEPAADLAAFEGQGKRASTNIDRMYRGTRGAELAQSRGLYEAPELTGARVNADPLVEVAEELRALDTPAAPLDGTVQKYVDRFRRPEVDEATGEVTRPGFAEGQNISMGEVNRIRAEVEKDIQSNLGNGAVVRQLRAIKDVLSGYTDDLAEQGNAAAQAAVTNYAERVRPNFREGAGGRMNDKMVADPNGTRVRPSQTAGEFLTHPEDAADLMRIAALRGNEAQTAQNARTWLFDQLAQKGVVKDEAIDPAKLSRWRNRNADLLDQVPGLRAEVDGMVRDAQRGADLRTRYGAELKAAEARVTQTRKEVDAGPLGMVGGKAPDKAVGAVFASDNPQAAMRALRKEIGANKQADDGLKAAVADWFEAKVSNVNPANVSEGSQTIGYAQLVKEFKKHEKTLAEVFDADEMNALRRAQKVLEPLGRRQGQATTGSVTAENSEMAWRAVEAGMKLWFGMLKGGGIMRSMRLAATTLGDDSVQQANRLVARMMFDPELAKHLLTRKVAEVGTPAWNDKLQKIIRRTQAVKELQDED